MKIFKPGWLLLFVPCIAFVLWAFRSEEPKTEYCSIVYNLYTKKAHIYYPKEYKELNFVKGLEMHCEINSLLGNMTTNDRWIVINEVNAATHGHNIIRLKREIRESTK